MDLPKYSLPKHIHVCMDNGFVAVLDARRNRYYAINARQYRDLAAVVPGWPIPGSEEDAEVDVNRGIKFANSLVRQGILCADPQAGKHVKLTAISRPNGAFENAEITDRKNIRIDDVLKFIISTFQTVFKIMWLRVSPGTLEKLIVSHKNLKLDNNNKTVPDIYVVKTLVGVYKRIRPSLFGFEDACFFDSLTLLSFLQQYGIYADWLIGVRLKPWGAHCWVQYQGVVLNDTLESVCRTTPILSI